VDLAKIELRNVLRRLEENYTNAKEQIYSKLTDLYDNFFDIRTTSDITPNSPSSKDGSDCDLNSLSIAPPQINDENINCSNAAKKKKKRKPKTRRNAKDPVILWLRRDLRIYDNPALNKAACTKDGEEKSVIPVFIWNEKEEKERGSNGGAVKVWLERALEELDTSLANNYGSRLILRRCKDSTEQELINVVKETGAKTVVWTALYEPWILERDAKIKYKLNGMGVTVDVEHSYLLHRPDEICVEDTITKGIGSVVHFLECCKRSIGSRSSIGTPIEPPSRLQSPSVWPSTCQLQDMRLYVKPVRKDGTVVDWAKNITANGVWKFGENGGFSQLCHFLEANLSHYEKESSRADMPWTSVISPYLHWGELSPRTVLNEALSRGFDAAKFRRKLAWRDMSYWILSLFPDMDSQPIRPHYEMQWWSDNEVHLNAWKKGNTGYPLIDAAMRQLWAIGWMNNYLRHVVASFLISYLRISWIEGYKWFQDTLLDADVAINAMMWQNGGMSGLDQWNFVMHPVDAALTCDPHGDFVRKWIPTLQNVPDKFIHCPWNCPPGILAKAGVAIGNHYPCRIIENLEDARQGSLADVATLRRHPLASPYIDPHSGRDLIKISKDLLKIDDNKRRTDNTKTRTKGTANTSILTIPLITRREFIYRTINPSAKDNPYNAVLRGYVTRKRDDEIARLQRVDFLSGAMVEEVSKYKKDNDIVEDKMRRGRNRYKHKLDGKA